MNDNIDSRAVAGQRFIDRVIDYLKHHMVETGAIIRITNVHTWPLTDRIQPLKYLDI